MPHECSLWPTFENVLLWALERLGQEKPVWLWELLESSHDFHYDFYSPSASLHFTDACGAERDALVDVCYIYEPGGPNHPNYTCCLPFITPP